MELPDEEAQDPPESELNVVDVEILEVAGQFGVHPLDDFMQLLEGLLDARLP